MAGAEGGGLAEPGTMVRAGPGAGAGAWFAPLAGLPSPEVKAANSHRRHARKHRMQSLRASQFDRSDVGAPKHDGQSSGFNNLPSWDTEAASQLYHLPFSRDAASVLSRFLWKNLSTHRLRSVIETFEALASSPSSQEAGLDSSQVLRSLVPAPRSMVGDTRRSPEGSMAEFMVAVAQVFRASVSVLALLAGPEGAGDSPTAQTSATSIPAPGYEAPALRTLGGGAETGSTPSTHSPMFIRRQVELLQDLCRAVGHLEGALVCATLLRDEAGVMNSLMISPPAVQVGYGRLISNLLKELQAARTALADSVHDRDGEEERRMFSLPGLESGSRSEAGDRLVGGGSGRGGNASAAIALMGLQQFGRDCARRLAAGAFTPR
ncbi:unnamed protein product [Discosporangium mesarthrocarpum]